MAAGEGGGHELRLLGSLPASPFVLRPCIALNLKGLRYEFVQEAPGGAGGGPKSELLVASNPVYKKIPVLLHNGEPLCESTIIVQYLDDAFPDTVPVLPADTRLRALHRFWAFYVDDKLVSAMAEVGKARTEEERKEAKEHALAVAEVLEEAFVDLSGGKPFFGGDGIGLLDIVFGSFLGWVKACVDIAGIVILDESRFPRLAAWAEHFCGHDAVKGVMPETATLVELYHKNRAAQAAAAASN